MKKPSKRQLTTLKAIAARLEFLGTNCQLVGLDGGRAGIAALGFAGYLEARNYREIGCRNSFEALFGRQPTLSESASHARTIRQLNDAGFIEAHRENVRISHVWLSLAGQQALQDATA